jgi:hypothetical protein
VPFEFKKLLSKSSVNKLRFLRVELMVMVLLGVGFIGSMAWSSGKLSSFWSAIQPHDQQYTALAFTNVNNLPYGIFTSDKLSFAFTIQNEEGRPTAYTYIVTGTTASDTRQLISGDISLSNNQEVTIPINLSFLPADKLQKITVSLPGQSESIDFILNPSAS